MAPRFLLLITSLFVFAFGVLAQQSRTPCHCGGLIITSSQTTATEGDTIEFEIKTTQAHRLRGTLAWKISSGEILWGQGTTKIAVRAPERQRRGLGTTFVSPESSEKASSPLPDGFVRSTTPIAGPIIYRPPVLSVSVEVTGPDSCQCSAISEVTLRPRREEVINQVANVTELRLGSTTLVLPCEPGRAPIDSSSLPTGMIVDVETKAVDPEDDVLTYNYTVSGGKITGTGASVKWDLTGVAAGKYTITVGADDGCGICGATRTQEVVVRECVSCGLIECATISITGPDKLDGESTFAVTVAGGTQQVVSYKWTVTNGEILSGQGTPSITAILWSQPDDLISSVTVELRGLEKGGCVHSVTKTFKGGIAQP